MTKEHKKDVTDDNGDENEERGNWSGKLDFLLSLLGYAVGTGNVWRFPYLCYRNGGGAFLIPYFIMLIFVGMPIFYLEVALGQFCSNGPLTCWEFAPIFKGIGLAQNVVSALVSIYYNMIIAWAIYYLFSSFINITNLPWQLCGEWWNTFLCKDSLKDENCTEVELTKYDNGTCYNDTHLLGVYDYQLFQNKTNLTRALPSQEYYNNRVLRLSSGIDEIGPVFWDLALCLLCAWIICFFCMIKGIKSSGKVVYFTALFPYVVLIILLGRGASLPGAADGLVFYLKPDFARLADAKVWNDAAVQIFFSLSNCWGGLIALASYNKFNNNCFRDTLIVTLSNSGTSIFAGLVIFSFLGFLAKELGTSVDKVADTGPGLAFVVYPDAVTRMPISALWAILFFVMLLTLGLDSQFATLETVLTSMLDQFAVLRPHKTKVVAVLCILLYLIGLPLCTESGGYILQLMDTYCGGWALLVIGFVECLAISWVYGCPRYYKDIELMLGFKQSIWWRICWQGISPAIILFVLIFQLVDYSPARYGDYYFPLWADVLGWMMTCVSIIWIPIIAIILIIRDDSGGLLQRLRNLTRPTIYWGPSLVKHRALVNYVKGFVVDPTGKGDAQMNGQVRSIVEPDMGTADKHVVTEVNKECILVSYKKEPRYSCTSHDNPAFDNRV